MVLRFVIIPFYSTPVRGNFHLPPIVSRGKTDFSKLKLPHTLTIFGHYGILAHIYTIMAMPIKSLELHYPMIQVLIMSVIQ